MRGKIEIEVIDGLGVSVKSSLDNVTGLDVVCLCEALLQGFSVDEGGRRMIGTAIAMGGPSVIPGVDMTVIRPTEELLRMMKERRDDQRER